MEGTVPDLVEALLACADTTRLRILHLLLSERELCVYDLVDVTGASQPKISRHLAYLRRSGLVTSRKDGLWVFYRISTNTTPPITVLIDSLAPILAQVPELEADLVTLDSLSVSRTSGDRRYRALEQKPPRPSPLPSSPEAQPTSQPQPQFEAESADLEVELL
jgi:ArsR family transcriptional regulator